MLKHHAMPGMVLLAGLVIFCSGAEREVVSPPATQSTRLSELVEKLGAVDFADREASLTQLVDLGDTAVPTLKKIVETTTDPEIRQRASGALERIASAPYMRPSLVTLQHRKAPAAEVYESLFRQAGVELSTWTADLFDRQRGAGDEIPPVTIAVDKVPFWQAFSELYDQTGIHFESFGRKVELNNRMMDHIVGKASITGPFMVVADGSSGDVDIRCLKVFVEPRLRVVSTAREPDIEDAVDINGDPIPVPKRDERRGPREFDEFFAANVFDVDLPVAVPRTGGLRGSIPIYVLTEEKTVELEGIAEAKVAERVVDGQRILFSGMDLGNGEWKALLTVSNGNAGVQQDGLQATLKDAKGTSLKVNGQSSASIAKRTDVAMNFRQGPKDGAPVKFSFSRRAENVRSSCRSRLHKAPSDGLTVGVFS